jgi:hypothetical protein
MSSWISSHEICSLTPKLAVIVLVAQEPDGVRLYGKDSSRASNNVVGKPISLRATIHVRVELEIIGA